MADLTREFLDAMNAAGVIPLEPVAGRLSGGKFCRFRCEGDNKGRLNGWAIYHSDWGAFGNWRTGISGNWRAGENTQVLTNAERRNLDEQCRRLEAARHAQADLAARKACEAWSKASGNASDHPYLTTKNLSAFGVRQLGAELLVPMIDRGFRLRTLQRIASDGSKRFMTGGSTDGLFWAHGIYLADGKPSQGPLAIAEGFATAAAIHEATGFGVVASMSAKNLMAVSVSMRELFPSRELIIAADNDLHLAHNIGLESARGSAERVSAALAIPEAASEAGGAIGPGIDFADTSRELTAALIQKARIGKAVAYG